MKTRKELFGEVASTIGSLAAEAVCVATAAQRHWARVERTIEAARAWVSAHLYNEIEATTLAAIVIALDLGGVGGSVGATGESTDRHPAFAALGKGRKQASDGDCYMAAAEAALQKLAGGWSLEVKLTEGRVMVNMLNHPEEAVFLAGTAPARWLRAEATRAAMNVVGFKFAKPQLVWQPEAIEAAFKECLFIEKDQEFHSWIEKARAHAPEELETWENIPSDEDADALLALNQKMEALGFGPKPEPAQWP